MMILIEYSLREFVSDAIQVLDDVSVVLIYCFHLVQIEINFCFTVLKPCLILALPLLHSVFI
jgi:hypothetical protein